MNCNPGFEKYQPRSNGPSTLTTFSLQIPTFFSFKIPTHTSTLSIIYTLAAKYCWWKLIYLWLRQYICRGPIPIIVWFHPAALYVFYLILLFSLQKCMYRECSLSFSPRVYNLTNIRISSHFPLVSEKEMLQYDILSAFIIYSSVHLLPSGTVLCHWACILIILPAPPLSGCWTR